MTSVALPARPATDRWGLQAERVVAKMDEAGSALGDFGLSLIKLSKFEDEEGSGTGPHTQQGAASRSLAADCRRTGMVRTTRACCSAHSSLPLPEPSHRLLGLPEGAGASASSSEHRVAGSGEVEPTCKGRERAGHLGSGAAAHQPGALSGGPSRAAWVLRWERRAACSSDDLIGACCGSEATVFVCFQAALKALREREAQLLTVQAIEVDIAKKHKALATLEEQVGLSWQSAEDACMSRGN